jgi:hypothetical protein
VRYFLSIVLACGILGVVGCGSNPPKGLHADTVLQRYIPADTTMLAGVEVQKLEQSPRYQHLQGELNQEHVNEVVQQLGFDPRKDVTAVLIASNGNAPIALARGKFPKQQLEAKFQAQHMQRTTYKGHEVFSHGENAVMFLRNDVMVAGQTQAVERLADDAAEDRGGIPHALQDRLAKLRKDATAWVVSDHGLPLMGVPLQQNVKSALSNIEGYVTGVTAGAAFDQDAHFQGDIDCISAEGAQRVHDALRGGIGLARLATNDNALDMLRLYDAIDVSKEDKRVKVRADLSASLVDKVLPYLPKVRQRVRQRLENAQ